MKISLIVLLIFPLFASSQINRSARELAGENVNTYLSTRIFKTRPYKQISISDVKAFEIKDSDIVWYLDQKIETEEIRRVSDTSSKTVKQLYHFRYYLDNKFEVLKSDCHFNVDNK